MKTYNRTVDVINFIGDSFKGNFSNKTLKSQLRKYHPENLDEFIGVDIIYLPTFNKHVLIQKSYERIPYTTNYEEIKKSRRPIGILETLVYNREKKPGRIKFTADYEKITNPQMIQNANEELKKI